MAKTINCKFCGKELKSGFFTGEGQILDIPNHSISCCDACYEHYKLSEAEAKRFAAKLTNLLKSTRTKRLPEQTVLQLYLDYVAQMHANQTVAHQMELPKFNGFCRYNDAGYFNVEEGAMGSIQLDSDVRKLLKIMGGRTESAFTAADVTRLDYRCVSKLGMGKGWVTNAYVFEIRLNDPAQLHYAPGVVYYPVAATAFLAHKRLRRAEKLMLEGLQSFKQKIGIDAPIRKIR